MKKLSLNAKQVKIFTDLRKNEKNVLTLKYEIGTLIINKAIEADSNNKAVIDFLLKNTQIAKLNFAAGTMRKFARFTQLSLNDVVQLGSEKRVLNCITYIAEDKNNTVKGFIKLDADKVDINNENPAPKTDKKTDKKTAEKNAANYAKFMETNLYKNLSTFKGSNLNEMLKIFIEKNVK